MLLEFTKLSELNSRIKPRMTIYTKETEKEIRELALSSDDSESVLFDMGETFTDNQVSIRLYTYESDFVLIEITSLGTIFSEDVCIARCKCLGSGFFETKTIKTEQELLHYIASIFFRLYDLKIYNRGDEFREKERD